LRQPTPSRIESKAIKIMNRIVCSALVSRPLRRLSDRFVAFVGFKRPEVIDSAFSP
jgi:hypothetical protein